MLWSLNYFFLLVNPMVSSSLSFLFLFSHLGNAHTVCQTMLCACWGMHPHVQMRPLEYGDSACEGEKRVVICTWQVEKLRTQW